MTIESRLPDPTRLLPGIIEAAGAVNRLNDGGIVPKTTADLVQLRVGQLLGSTYFTARILRGADDEPERLAAVATWRSATCFTGAERAALALAEAVYTPNPHGHRVSDEVYARAAEHYDERELVGLAVVLGQLGFFMPVALIGLPVPGKPLSEQWR